MPLPQQMNNDIAAQMQDMMNKSPGDVNHFDDSNGLHMPPQGFGAIDDKIREFRNADGLLHRGGDANNVMDDKNYEEGKNSLWDYLGFERGRECEKCFMFSSCIVWIEEKKKIDLFWFCSFFFCSLYNKNHSFLLKLFCLAPD